MMLRVSTAVVSARSRSSASRPFGVTASVEARASDGSVQRLTKPLSSRCVTSLVRVDGAMPSIAARSPSRIGPAFSTVARAASWVGVSPSSSRRSLRVSRARATRNRVTSITPASSAGAFIVDSRAMLADYAVLGAPHSGARLLP
jgi:hypothetical protein